MEKLGYRPALDGVRALAIALVMAGHVFHWPTNFALGVDLFFVLSGFLITTLLIEERRAHGSISLPRFYARRMLRLYPALLALVLGIVALAVVSSVVGHRAGTTLSDAWRVALFGLTYTMNIVVAAGSGTTDAIHLWSLAVEEQFYLLWPLLLVLLLRHVPRLVVRLAVVGVAIAAIAVLRSWLGAAHPATNFDASAVMRFDSILIGCLAGLAFAAAPRRTVRLSSHLVCSFVAVAAIAWLAFFDHDPSIYDNGKSVLFCVAGAVLVLGLLDERSPLAVALALPPFVFVGRISYALYLWHFPLRNTVARVHLFTAGSLPAKLATVVLTFAFATASYYVVERPFLRRKWRLARTESHDEPLGIALHDAATAT